MGKFDHQYRVLIERVIDNGSWQPSDKVRSKWKDGVPAPALAVFDEKLVIEAGTVPVLTNKKFHSLSALLELEWIWMKKSNVVADLREEGCNIWNEWEVTDEKSKWHGTIGPAYGYVLGQEYRKLPVDKVIWDKLDPKKEYTRKRIKGVEYVLLDQVDYLIQSLLTSPDSRRHVTSLWDLRNLDEMALEPCVWNTTWVVIDGVLNLKVGVRSNDLALGNPFNVYQYFILHRMIAQVVDILPGNIVFSIDNAHIYDRHITPFADQFNQPVLGEPKLWLNPEVTNFYEFDVRNDIKLMLPENSENIKSITFEIAI